MRKRLLLLATLGCSISWVPAHATTITIDLGPPGRVTGEKIVSFSELFDQAGNPISSVTSFGGSVTTDPGGEALRLALGGFFPLLADGAFPPDIYGAHLDI